jgi:hypothetical protein
MEIMIGKFQEGGGIPPAGAPMGGAPVEGGAPPSPEAGMEQLMTLVTQALEGQDCQAALGACELLLQMLSSQGGGAAQPPPVVSRKGGTLKMHRKI